MHARHPYGLLASVLVFGCAGERQADGGSNSAKATASGSPDTPPTVVVAAPPPGSATAGASAAPASPKADGDLSVLVVSIDSMRADMPWLGYGRDIAPRLTEFAKSAVTYSRFYSVSSYTSMSLGGFLGGRYPSELERSGYFFGNYPDDVLMFPELLQKAGVRTVSAHAHFYFDKKAGFRQGFDLYEIVPGLSADNTTDRNVTSPKHLELATQMLGDKANTGGRFFAWFHFLDPHDVYVKHKDRPSFGTKDRDLYDGEMHFTDEHVGKLLDFVAAQPWGKKTAVFITADHGEAFGEKKMTRHGFELWEVLVRVPLLVRLPGAAPRRIDVPRSMIDLPPTFLELLGAPPEKSFAGESLVSELRGGPAPERPVIVDLPRTSDNDRRRALVWQNYKLIAFGDDFGFELYDVAADPTETKDLKREKKDVFEEMKKRYAEATAKIQDRCPKMTEKLKGKGKGKKC